MKSKSLSTLMARWEANLFFRLVSARYEKGSADLQGCAETSCGPRGARLAKRLL